MCKLLILALLISSPAYANESNHDLNATVRGNRQVSIETVDLQPAGPETATSKPMESIDQYLNRMRMRRDDMQYQACLERMRFSAVEADQSNAISACVPPDYSVPEMQKYSEWNGTVMGGLA